VVGVRTVRGGRAEERTGADLVVDASGRATLSPRWLAEAGGPEIPVETERIDLTYVSRPYRRRGRDLGGRVGTASWAYPGQPYGGWVLAEEGDRCTLMISGFSAAPGPAERELLQAAGHLPTGTLADLIRTGEPLGPAALMRFPAERRFRFDRVALPEGFLPIGDAICSFNPSYGQGMTVAAMEARLLGELLAAGPDNLTARFLAASAPMIDVPWGQATANDRRFRPGYDPAADPVAPLRAGLARDRELAVAYLRVAQLIDPPSRLAEPDIAARVRAATAPV
jgi:flavin-dependent dehydrogenase